MAAVNMTRFAEPSLKAWAARVAVGYIVDRSGENRFGLCFSN